MELWEMWSIPSLILLPGPLLPEMVLPFRVSSIDQTEMFNHLTE